ncbi:hypothetical protein FXO37_01797 [Capsicum annuum]|nr:hypothetical protein FXO37_01797 [Capsicum annuum]
MSFTGPSMGSVAGTARRAFEFGQTYVVKPKGKHQATIVWLHGLGDNGSSFGFGGGKDLESKGAVDTNVVNGDLMSRPETPPSCNTVLRVTSDPTKLTHGLT